MPDNVRGSGRDRARLRFEELQLGMTAPIQNHIPGDNSRVMRASFIATAGRWLHADDLIRHASKLGVGAAASLAISLATMPILTRIYGPDAFGLFGIFFAVLSLAALVGTGRYEQAVALPAADRDASALVMVGRRLLLGASILATLTLPFRQAIAEQLGEPNLAPWWWALPPAIWMAGQVQIATAWAARSGDFGRIARARLALTVATIMLQLALMRLGDFALLAGLFVGLIAQYCWFHISANPPPSISSSEISQRATEYRRFPLYILPAALVDSLTFQLPLLLGGTWFGIGFVGMYAMATRIMGLPSTLVGNAVAHVFYQDFSRRHQSANGARTFLFRTWLRLALIGAVPMLLVAYFGEPLFLRILGPEWAPAGNIAVILTPMFFAMFVSSPTSGALLVLRGERLSLAFSLSFLTYRVAGLWLGTRMDNPALGLGVIAAAEVVTIVVYNGIILHRLGANPA